MGQESSTLNARRPIREVIGAGTVFAGLVMLKSLASHRIAEREQEIIVIVVMRVE